MIQRTALLAASLVAALTLAVGLVLAGFVPRADPVDALSAAPAAPVAATAEAPTSPTVQVDTVYLAAPVKPQDITITKPVTSSVHADDEGAGGDND